MSDKQDMTMPEKANMDAVVNHFKWFLGQLRVDLRFVFAHRIHELIIPELREMERQRHAERTASQA